ncbi:MAG: ribosomal subunit interface protein [Clostridia bacterium]|nr:ribosomal subunit interface protein [Clostridia bacterium]
MQFIFSSRRCTVWESTKVYTEKKLKKLEKFFTGDCIAHVIFTLEKENLCKVEVTVDYCGIIFRAQETTYDFNVSVDKIVDILIRQIRKHKTKLEKRLRESDFLFDDSNNLKDDKKEIIEDEYKVIRNKNIIIKPMSVEEAILQMNMLGHDFYIFKETEALNVQVIYRRKDGNYGLLDVE